MFLHKHKNINRSNINGMILGAFTNCEPKDDRSLSLMEVFNEIIVTENKPTLYNLVCGHCLPTLSLPLGAKVIIDGEKSEITIL
ncbi:hypothetical protein ACN077_09370 [Clostridium chromiireducens]|uniref:hypothetical protein n=1 Tax=Clostridium chromiireducens TaxID=225345 RepID=UPI003AF548B1